MHPFGKNADNGMSDLPICLLKFCGAFVDCTCLTILLCLSLAVSITLGRHSE